MSRSVVVVGGGLAGITAALACADQGADVVLVERRSRLGGLTWSFRRHGLWFDNGQHVFLRCCTAYLDLLQRLGVADLVHLQDRLAVPVVAPAGTSAPMRVALQLVGDVAVPWNVTRLAPWVAPKFVPVIITAVPTAPAAGVALVRVGGAAVRVTLLTVLPVTTDGLWLVTARPT